MRVKGFESRLDCVSMWRERESERKRKRERKGEKEMGVSERDKSNKKRY